MLTSTKRKYVRRDWDSIIEQWRASGVSHSKFCAEASVPLASFHAALKRNSSESDADAAMSGFARMKIVPQLPAQIVVELPSGIRVSVNGVDAAELISRLSGGY